MRRSKQTVRVPVLSIVGSHSPHLEVRPSATLLQTYKGFMQASLAANRRLDPATATWLKISGTGMVLEVIL